MEYKTKISEEEIEELPNFTFDGEIIVIDHEDKLSLIHISEPTRP